MAIYNTTRISFLNILNLKIHVFFLFFSVKKVFSPPPTILTMAGSLPPSDDDHYQYDVNIQFRTEGERDLIAAEEIADMICSHLQKQYSLDCYTPHDAVLGGSILDSGFDAIRKSR